MQHLHTCTLSTLQRSHIHSTQACSLQFQVHDTRHSCYSQQLGSPLLLLLLLAPLLLLLLLPLLDLLHGPLQLHGLCRSHHGGEQGHGVRQGLAVRACPWWWQPPLVLVTLQGGSHGGQDALRNRGRGLAASAHTREDVLVTEVEVVVAVIDVLDGGGFPHSLEVPEAQHRLVRHLVVLRVRHEAQPVHVVLEVALVPREEGGLGPVELAPVDAGR
mmetsp:Transcript_29223/g.64664  ORF Transcript_29223/g.64664 Transcript_29223/m.64664 type:complete len:216 (-) Transcript_29223:3368-4015(-)